MRESPKPPALRDAVLRGVDRLVVLVERDGEAVLTPPDRLSQLALAEALRVMMTREGVLPLAEPPDL